MKKEVKKLKDLKIGDVLYYIESSTGEIKEHKVSTLSIYGQVSTGDSIMINGNYRGLLDSTVTRESATKMYTEATLITTEQIKYLNTLNERDVASIIGLENKIKERGKQIQELKAKYNIK